MYYMVGDVMENTMIFDSDEFKDSLIEEVLKNVVVALEEKGYNPIDQIVGYLISGDPGYISNHKGARKQIMQFDRNQVLETIVRNYIEK